MEYLVALLLVGAAAWDMFERRVPNGLVLLLVGLGFVFHFKSDGIDGLATSLGGLGIGFVALLPGYALRAVGAGDVKLMAGVGACVGGLAALDAAVKVYLLGLVAGLAILLARRLAATVPAMVGLNETNTFPYAPVIAASGLLVLFGGG